MHVQCCPPQRGLLRNLVNAADGCCALQDAIKKNSKDELPDFYNIVLDRPKDDAAGYDVLFIDAASKVSGQQGQEES